MKEVVHLLRAREARLVEHVQVLGPPSGGSVCARWRCKVLVGCRLRPVSARRVTSAQTLPRGSPPAPRRRAPRRAPSSCRRRRRLPAPRLDRDSRGSDRPPRAGARSDAAMPCWTRLACHVAGERGMGLLAGAHRLDRVALERRISRVVKAAGPPGSGSTDEFAGGHASGDLGLDRRDRRTPPSTA